MSLTIEWDEAATVEIEVLTADEALEDLQPDSGTVSGPVLVIGGASGGAFAIEATSFDELEALCARMRYAVRAAR